MNRSDIRTYADLAKAIDDRGVKRVAVANRMRVTPDALSKVLTHMDPAGQPSQGLIDSVFDALEALWRGAEGAVGREALAS